MNPVGQLKDPFVKMGDRMSPEIGKGAAIDLEAEGLGLQACPTAAATGRIRAVAAQKDTDMHFVGTALHPLEESLHPIPFVAFPCILRVVTLSVENPVLFLLVLSSSP